MASMIDNSGDFIDQLETQIAISLLKAGAVLVSAYQINVTQSYPPASKAGQYPKFRTGTGRSAATYRPTAIGQVRTNGFEVVVGLLKPGLHMAWLELNFHRKGFKASLEENADRIGRIISGQ